MFYSWDKTDVCLFKVVSTFRGNTWKCEIFNKYNGQCQFGYGNISSVHVELWKFCLNLYECNLIPWSNLILILRLWEEFIDLWRGWTLNKNSWKKKTWTLNRFVPWYIGSHTQLVHWDLLQKWLIKNRLFSASFFNIQGKSW